MVVADIFAQQSLGLALVPDQHVIQAEDKLSWLPGVEGGGSSLFDALAATSWRLVDRGFHFINEEPFNR